MADQTGLEDPPQTLWDHLDELRKRLLISVVAVGLGAVVAFVLHREILQLLMGPADGFETLRDSKLVYTGLTEMLAISMKVSIIGGFVLALPIVVYEAVVFIAPGLTDRERKYLLLSLPGISVAFVVGVLFGYFVLLPPALHFLLTFNSDIATPLITIGNYVNLTFRLLFWLGIVFETPLVMFILAKLRLVTHRTFSRRRRIGIILAFVLGAIITPTFDPVNQTLVAIPIIVLYEIGIWLAWLARRGEKSLVSAKT
jgi:sec-independent protein translocase protein TatC